MGFIAVVIGAFIGALLGAWVVLRKLADRDQTGVILESYREVQMSRPDGSIRVDPPVTRVKTGQTLIWYLDAKPGDANKQPDKIQIEFISPPIPGDPNDPRRDPFGGKGVYDFEGPGFIETEKAPPLPPGVSKELWRYNVTWSRDGEPDLVLDPGIMRREDD